MARLEHINIALHKLSRFLEPLLPLVGCHMVEFLTMNHWDTFVPPKLQQDLLHLPQEKLQYLPAAALDCIESDADLQEWNLQSSDLSSFQMAIKKHSLPALNITSSIEQVLSEAKAEVMDIVAMKGVMSDKKSHEVEIMSNIIAQLARGCDVDWIVDVGSGRGYLSSSLVLQYGMNIVAIDSSKTNTASGLVRNSRMQRHWVNQKKAEQDRQDGKYIKKGKKRRGKKPQDLKSVDQYMEFKTQPNSSKATVKCGRYIGVTRFVTEDMDLNSLVNCVVDGENRIINCVAEDETRVGLSESNGVTGTVSENGITKHNSGPEMNESSLDNISTDKYSSSPSNSCSSSELTNNLSYINITNNSIKASHNVDKLVTVNHFNTDREVEENTHTSSDKYNNVPKHTNLALVGLHTCGNLAASSVRIFLANPTVSLLCNVGCCYHLIEEEFAKNTYNYRKLKKSTGNNLSEALPSESPTIHNSEADIVQNEKSEPSYNSEIKNVPSISPVTNHDRCQNCVWEEKENGEKMGEPHTRDSDRETIDLNKRKENMRENDVTLDPLHPSEIPNLGYGFPLSSVLRESKFALSRNVRMLSCQSADRLTQQNFTRTESLYWRALLQVILLDKLGGDRSDIGHVGRISAKCNTFIQYASLAIDKLGLPIQVSEDELNSYLEEYKDARVKIERFFLLRASVAPVIEGLILLDRLAFLKEQDANISSHLVQLFDPVISPRCHALLALRPHQSSS